MSKDTTPNGVRAPVPRRNPKLSYDMLGAVLAHELDLLSDDDIEHAPESVILSALGGPGSDRESATEKMLRVLAKDDGARKERLVRSVSPARTSSYVARDELIARCLSDLRKTSNLVMSGPSGSGKSFFLNELFSPSRPVRNIYPRIVRIDCSALRMKSAALFEREAIWTTFGKRDDAFRRFLRETTLALDESGLAGAFHLGGAKTLISLLQNKFLGIGLVIFDHIEHLDRSGEVDAWLCEFCKGARDVDIHLLFCQRTSESSKPFRALAGMTETFVPPLSEAEITHWLGHPDFIPHRQSDLTASDIMSRTGGSPSLLRDLISFLKYEPQTRSDPPKLLGRKALDAFERMRASNYMNDCERYIRASRYYPGLLLSGIKLMNEGTVPKAVVDRVIASGAVRLATQPGTDSCRPRYAFSSPIHAARIEMLMRPENLIILAETVDSRAVAEGGLGRLKKVAELASGPISRYLATQRKPHQALARFRYLLESWGLDAIIHVRDPYNARLWCVFDKPHDLRPLSSFEEPDFAQAVQTGQAAIDEEGRLFLPMTGNSGVVEIVIEGTFRQKAKIYRRDIEIDRFTGIIRSLRPTLAQTLERFALYRHRQISERLLHKMEFDDPSQGWLSGVSALKETSCMALAIMERSSAEWFATKIETANGVKLNEDWTEASDLQRLDAISTHPSRRGLVLKGGAVWAVFPRLGGREISVYVRPVWVHRQRVCRLVVFVFEGRGMRSLDGQLQRQLSAVAHELIAAAS